MAEPAQLRARDFPAPGRRRSKPRTHWQPRGCVLPDAHFVERERVDHIAAGQVHDGRAIDRDVQHVLQADVVGTARAGAIDAQRVGGADQCGCWWCRSGRRARGNARSKRTARPPRGLRMALQAARAASRASSTPGVPWWRAAPHRPPPRAESRGWAAPARVSSASAVDGCAVESESGSRRRTPPRQSLELRCARARRSAPRRTRRRVLKRRGVAVGRSLA